ncbi:MAG: c-type cytochrome domain-containing protein [Longimicrobiales bacterium]|nr:c-type cytochrome domain-containing protein [Longimicrobiales bacterium]
MAGDRPAHGEGPTPTPTPTPTPGDRFRRSKVEAPTGPDLARQLGIVAIVLLAWIGSFRLAMNLPVEAPESARSEERRSRGEARGVTEEGPTPGAGVAAGVTGADSPGVGSNGTGSTEGDAGGVAAAGDPLDLSDAGEPLDGTAPIPAASSPVRAGNPPASGPTASSSADASGVAPADPVATEIDPVTAFEEEAARSRLPNLDDLPVVGFAEDVMPILERRCVKCHGAPRDDGTLRIEEGLDLRTWDAIMAGSTWGAVVVPGDPVASYMLELVLEGKMPDDGPRLLPREVRILTAWIAQGADER